MKNPITLWYDLERFLMVKVGLPALVLHGMAGALASIAVAPFSNIWVVIGVPVALGVLKEAADYWTKRGGVKWESALMTASGALFGIPVWWAC